MYTQGDIILLAFHFELIATVLFIEAQIVLTPGARE